MAIDQAALMAQLNIVGTLDEVDAALLPRLLLAASRHVENDLGFKLDNAVELPADARDDVEQAVLMLAAHWYENREATLVGVTAQALPFGYEAIIANHRIYTYG